MPAAPTALIVDDDKPILGLLEDIFAEAGYAVTSFGLGQPALDALQQQHFDVLIADVWLPDMNGMSICEMARDVYEGKITILMISADTRRQIGVTAMQICADDFMGKPFNVDEMTERIRARLRNRVRSAGA